MVGAGHDDLLSSEKVVDQLGKQRVQGGPGDVLINRTGLKGSLFKNVHTDKHLNVRTLTNWKMKHGQV